MDRYTLMVSKLTQLQDEWEPKRFDIVWYDNQVWHITSKDPLCYYLRADKQNDLFASKIEKGLLIYKPSLEALIEMWKKENTPLLIEIYENTCIAYGDTTQPERHSDTIKEAIIQLLAYKKWHLVWSDEKEDWEEG